MLKQHTVVSRCNSHCKYHHSNMYCIFYSLVKEHSSSKEHPPLYFWQFSVLAGSKFTLMSAHPGASFAFLMKCTCMEFSEAQPQRYAYPKLEKFMLYFAKGYKLWRRNLAALTSYAMPVVTYVVVWLKCSKCSISLQVRSDASLCVLLFV